MRFFSAIPFLFIGSIADAQTCDHSKYWACNPGVGSFDLLNEDWHLLQTNQIMSNIVQCSQDGIHWSYSTNGYCELLEGHTNWIRTLPCRTDPDGSTWCKQ